METNPSSSSSSSSPPVKRFDVFLSFRGEDTRNNFTDHLYHALSRSGLCSIFRDDNELAKGKDIGPELMKAIEDSHYAVVVLSENYATSSWCLKELAKIVECMGDSGRIRTIFFHVNPSHVRNVISSDVKKQEESSFWKALNEHAKIPSHSEYLESWRNALVKVANQSGHPVEPHTSEAIFIRDFVADMSSQLGASIGTIDGLFGMTSRLSDLDSYVLKSAGTNKVCFIGIHGMGGIGKTTLAKAYYNKMFHKFDGSSFLQNIREACTKEANGLVSLQKNLLKGILEVDFKIDNDDIGKNMIKRKLHHKNVLIVLDDVSELNQLHGLSGKDDWFGSKSVILVTTRNKNFLESNGYIAYRAKSLNDSDALHLFSSKAFGSIEPPEEFMELSERVVECTSSLPLALTVLGSVLRGKKKSEWESALRGLRKCSEKEIFETLKISFDDLKEADQSLFLDIACFFNGFYKDDIIKILSSCGFESIKFGIAKLLDKSLLSINEGVFGSEIIWMHDLLQDMGKEIVRQKSGNEVERQSRIWDAVHLHRILENSEGTNEVKAIVTRLDDTKEYNFEALSSMKKLRLLYINGLHGIYAAPDDSDPDGSNGSGSYGPDSRDNDGPNGSDGVDGSDGSDPEGSDGSDSDGVVGSSHAVYGSDGPDSSVGSDDGPSSPVAMPNCDGPDSRDGSDNSDGPSGTDGSGSDGVDSSDGPDGSDPDGGDGSDSDGVYGSYGRHRSVRSDDGPSFPVAMPNCDGPEFSLNLQYLEWRKFPYTKLPPSFKPRSLVQLKLQHSKLRRLWNNGIKPFYNLKVIDLSDSTYFTEFKDFTVVPNLEELILAYCSSLSEIHPSIKHLKKLIRLDLSFCSSLKKLPEEINGLSSLQTLELRYCFALEKLPDSLVRLKSLRELHIDGSYRIKRLPQPIFLLANIELISCGFDGNQMIESPIRENIISQRTIGKCCLPGTFRSGLRGLTRLDLNDCNLTGPEAFPEYFGRLVDLIYLDLSKNRLSVLPPGISGLSRLERLKLHDCNLTGPEAFPEYFDKLVNLKYLDLSNNPLSVLPPGISRLSNLVDLKLEHCKSLRCLEAELLPSSLSSINVSYCTSLASFVDPLKPCHLRCLSHYCLDCTDLVKGQDGKMTALASLTRFLEDPSTRRDRDFEFVVPQSDNELPSWFINQSSTSSITIKLDANRAKSELIGVAMVFCANSSMENYFRCKIRDDSGRYGEITIDLGFAQSRMSDHLFLHYKSCGLFYNHGVRKLRSRDTLEFEFSFFSDRCSSCEPCGVRLVYEEDIKELKEITNKYINDQKDVQSSHSQSSRKPKNRRSRFGGRYR